MGCKGQIVCGEITALPEMGVVDRRNKLTARLRHFDGPLILDFRHVVGVSRVSRKRDRVSDVHLRHDIRHANRDLEFSVFGSENQSATLFGSDIERMLADLVKDLIRDQTALEVRVQIDSFGQGLRPTRSNLERSVLGDTTVPESNQGSSIARRQRFEPSAALVAPLDLIVETARQLAFDGPPRSLTTNVRDHDTGQHRCRSLRELIPQEIWTVIGCRPVVVFNGCG